MMGNATSPSARERAGYDGSVTTDAFRANLRALLMRSGRSQRGLSAAFGRDPGYVGALLDPTRPARARPTPEDLERASDALGIPFVELLELLWEIPRERLVSELLEQGFTASGERLMADLGEDDRAELARYARYLAERSSSSRRS